MKRKASGKTSRHGRSQGRVSKPAWANLGEEELLDLRMCDLGLKIEGTWLETRIEQVYGELQKRNLSFRPHFWLSAEWFVPDGVGGAAMPFYLAHPRLMELEYTKMLEVEGGTHEWCMRLLRHELGHAYDNAYRLHRRRRWRELFGKASQPYPDHYQPRPYSKRYVLHLDDWYAQSHPCEDFAETFAVWLAPGSRWRRRYAGWPALKKLEYVDELMKEIAGTRPVVTSRERVDPLRELRTTLREYYEEKQARYGMEYPDFYDRDLRRLFSDNPGARGREPASRFLRRVRPEIRRLVARWTGTYQYTIDQVLREMISRSSELRLKRNQPEKATKIEAAVLLTVQTMNHLHAGHHRLAM